MTRRYRSTRMSLQK
jgi:hypothetical protein